jgi:hypothetical protein
MRRLALHFAGLAVLSLHITTREDRVWRQLAETRGAKRNEQRGRDRLTGHSDRGHA